MPLVRFPTPTGLVYTIDLTKIADRANPRTVEAPIGGNFIEPIIIDWGDGTVEKYSTGTFDSITHTYAGTDNVFTVTIRSVTGKLPWIKFSNGYQATEYLNPTRSITHAVTSIDHVSGTFGNQNVTYIIPFCNGCINLTYADTRLFGAMNYHFLTSVCRDCWNLEQPIHSFCFDFCAADAAGTFSTTFYKCGKLYGELSPLMFSNLANITGSLAEMFRDCVSITGDIPSTLFDVCRGITNVNGAFRGCTGLTAPYKFWEKDYAASITNSANCYAGCTGMDLTQVPTAYGGTMTVS